MHSLEAMGVRVLGHGGGVDLSETPASHLAASI